MPNRDIANIRNHYQRDALDWAQLPENPMEALKKWLEQAILAKLYEPTAMTLATVDNVGNPHARIVLLKGIDHGLCFYTNYLSAKGQDLEYNHAAALVLFWPELERQIRIEGLVEKIDAIASENYFQSRPLDSQIAASISQQSQIIKDRDELEQLFDVAKEKSNHEPVKRPDHWGGYRLIPNSFEFWQGRPNRLHDRLQWQKKSGDIWMQQRLAP